VCLFSLVIAAACLMMQLVLHRAMQVCYVDRGMQRIPIQISNIFFIKSGKYYYFFNKGILEIFKLFQTQPKYMIQKFTEKNVKQNEKQDN
jgi:hypothetical protein